MDRPIKWGGGGGESTPCQHLLPATPGPLCAARNRHCTDVVSTQKSSKKKYKTEETPSPFVLHLDDDIWNVSRGFFCGDSPPHHGTPAIVFVRLFGVCRDIFVVRLFHLTLWPPGEFQWIKSFTVKSWISLKLIYIYIIILFFIYIYLYLLFLFLFIY